MLASVNSSSCLAETFQVTGWLFMSYHCYAPVLRQGSSGSDAHTETRVSVPKGRKRSTDKNENSVIMPDLGHVECVCVLVLSCACV